MTSTWEKHEIEHVPLLGVPVAVVSVPLLIQKVVSWIEQRERGRVVNFCNTHMIVEAIKNPTFARQLRSADVNCPDGMPLVWYNRSKGYVGTQKVCGPDFLPAFCSATERMHLRHYFYGGAEGIAAQAAAELQARFPGMQIAGAYSPPFRPLTEKEEEEIVRSINETNPDLIWICLGCPKQEIWANSFHDRLNASVLLPVGLALDIAAGAKNRAPSLMSRVGLEWLYRLFQEPRRLWRRYLVYNGIFIYRLLLQEFGIRGG